MPKTYALSADLRDGTGKGAARALRREGKTPAVIYGDGKEPITITLDTNAINVEYNRGHMFTTLCDLALDGSQRQILARDIQLHPVSDVVEHVDFLRVTDKTSIAVEVPVQFVNEDKSPSLKENGTLNVVRFEVELVCKATSIPDYIEVNVEGKEHGDAVKISDAVLPEGTKPVIDDRDFTIATLVAPKTAAELEAEEAADAEAPEDNVEREEGEEGDAAAEGGDAEAEKAEE